MNYKERLKDYLEGYSSQYDFTDENNIEHNLNDDIEEMLKQNQRLEHALDEIEKYAINLKENHIFWENDDFTNGRNAAYEMISDDILKIIQKAKGE